jgi:predicted NAD/FAD-dependent oxidoreductase
LHDGGGAVSTAAIARFDAVILAMPAPQAVVLMERSGVGLPGAEAAGYAPCWALLVAMPWRVERLPDTLAPGEGAIGWLARNGSKPGRAALPESIVVHATPAWSKAHLERTPEEVRSLLLAELAPHVGGVEPIYAAAHRWRYALVEQTAGRPFLWDGAAGLGACGDWCVGGRVEAAFDSGDLMAGQVIAELGWTR